MENMSVLERQSNRAISDHNSGIRNTWILSKQSGIKEYERPYIILFTIDL